jgi:hypothetical protein
MVYRQIPKHVHEAGGSLLDSQLLISTAEAGRWSSLAEYDDKLQVRQQRPQGVPIPIPIPQKSTQKSRAQQHCRSCGLDMDSEAVLDALAACEGGGFNKDWQSRGQHPSL